MKTKLLSLLLFVLSSHTIFSQTALEFDGVDDYVTTGSNLVNYQDTRTFEAWFNSSNITNGFNAILTMERNNPTTEEYFQIMLDINGNLYINDTNNAPIFSSSISYADGIWHHVAYVREASSPTSGAVYYYVDGVLIGSNTYTTTFSTIDPDVEFRIGNSEYQGGSYYMDGLIDDVRVWNTARSQAEIQSNMNSCLTGTETGLIALYDFEDGTSNTLTDLTSNNNDGILNNMDTATAWTNSIIYVSNTIFVDASATGINIGNSWVNAYTSLQSALNAAYNCPNVTQIWVAAGTYYPSAYARGATDVVDNKDYTFHLVDGIALYGGFNGTETQLSDRDWVTNETILSGDINTPNVITDNVYHVVLTNNATSVLTELNGFTIRDGNATSITFWIINGEAILNDSGGGMYNNGSSLNITNTTFTGNSSYYGGGGIYNLNSSPSITNTSFSGNSANNYGGGMFNNNSSPNITNTTFSGNTAITDGGGMTNFSNSSPNITNTTFTGNSASDSGGGMFNLSNSSPNITNTTFSGNSANGGGGIYNNGSSPNITNTTFTGNSASNSGGGMINISNSSPNITNTTFSGNSASDSGGGMYNINSSSPSINNSVFYNNGTDVDGISFSTTGTNNYAQNYTATGFTTLTNDPFINSADPDGADNIWGTTDDGLVPSDSSVLIDAGDNTSLPLDTNDLDNDGNTTEQIPFDSAGQTRIYNISVDVGAYENVNPCNVLQTIIYVDANASGYNIGSSWANAYTSLQSALESAYNCPGITQVWVAEGTYYPSAYPRGATGVIDNKDYTFHLVDGIALYGGFNGTETQLSDRDWVTNETILSGDINTPNDLTDNVYHVVFTNNTTSILTELNGFTIRDGNATSNTLWNINGAFIYNRNGGGMYNNDSSLSITNTTFTGNSADFSGGGIQNDNSSPSITNTTFTGNSANYGGGMYNESSSPSITNTTFTGNSANSLGGGMYNESSSPSITNTTFSGNSANSGGGMFNISSSSPSITNTTFTGNSANSLGGGIFNSDNSSPNITNTTFTGNSANLGGGMYNSSNSSPSINNTTFTGNSANSLGGGMYNESSSLSINNSVFYNNGTDVIGDGFSASSANNYAQNYTATGFTTLTSDPFINSADPDGADNIWRTADDGLVPITGSVLIDAGDNASLPLDTNDLDNDGNTTEQIPFDIIGQIRIDNITVDVGAYEVQQSTLGSFNHELVDAFKVYPNPVKDVLIISAQSGGFKYKVSTIHGQVVTEHNSNALTAVVDCTKLTPGIYIVTIEQQGTKKALKFVKE